MNSIPLPLESVEVKTNWLGDVSQRISEILENDSFLDKESLTDDFEKLTRLFSRENDDNDFGYTPLELERRLNHTEQLTSSFLQKHPRVKQAVDDFFNKYSLPTTVRERFYQGICEETVIIHSSLDELGKSIPPPTELTSGARTKEQSCIISPTINKASFRFDAVRFDWLDQRMCTQIASMMNHAKIVSFRNSFGYRGNKEIYRSLFSGLHRVKMLSLDEALLSSDDESAFRDILKYFPDIWFLSMYHIDISKIQDLRAFFSFFPSLISLDLIGNGIGEGENKKILTEIFAKLKHLGIKNLYLDSMTLRERNELTRGLNNLRSLSLSGSTLFSLLPHEISHFLSNLPNLTSLQLDNISFKNMYEEQIDALFSSLPKLTHLTLGRNDLFYLSYRPIISSFTSKLSHLKSLDWGANDLFCGDPDLIDLLFSSLSTLESLDFSQIPLDTISESQLTQKLSSLTKLKHLRLADNLPFGNPSFIESLPCLESLSWSVPPPEEEVLLYKNTYPHINFYAN